MKLTSLFLSIGVCALPAFAAPVTYTMAFTGGLFRQGVFYSFAPTSGSFTYDPSSGFSNFTVDYDGDIFNLTASANAPSVCSSPGTCSPGTSVQEFQMLTNDEQWSAYEPVANGGTMTNFSIGNSLGGISADAPVFPGFGIGSPPRTGTFSLTLISSIPEPGTFKTLCVAGLCLLGVAYWGGRKRAIL